MAFTAKTRYGSMDSYADDAEIPVVVESLIRELETEDSGEPDDEHTQVAVQYGDWAVTVTVFGLMILDDMRNMKEGGFGEALFKRAASRTEAVAMLTLMANGKVQDVRAAGWVPRDQLPPYETALFRRE